MFRIASFHSHRYMLHSLGFYSTFIRRFRSTFNSSELLHSCFALVAISLGLLFNFCPRIPVDFWLFQIAPFQSCLLIYSFVLFFFHLAYITIGLLLELHLLRAWLQNYFTWVFRIGFLFFLAVYFPPIQPFFRSNCLNSLVHSLIHLQSF